MPGVGTVSSRMPLARSINPTTLAVLSSTASRSPADMGASARVSMATPATVVTVSGRDETARSMAPMFPEPGWAM